MAEVRPDATIFTARTGLHGVTKQRRKKCPLRAPPELGASADVHVAGRRILATIVNGLVFGGLFALMAALFGADARVDTFGWDATMPALPTVAYAFIVIHYYILMEGYLDQTLGKMLLGIKVVREDNGEVPELGTANIMTVLRIVDGPLSYLVAFVTVLISGKNQRFGDMASHTLVVRK